MCRIPRDFRSPLDSDSAPIPRLSATARIIMKRQQRAVNVLVVFSSGNYRILRIPSTHRLTPLSILKATVPSGTRGIALSEIMERKKWISSTMICETASSLPPIKRPTLSDETETHPTVSCADVHMHIHIYILHKLLRYLYTERETGETRARCG